MFFCFNPPLRVCSYSRKDSLIDVCLSSSVPQGILRIYLIQVFETIAVTSANQWVFSHVFFNILVCMFDLNVYIQGRFQD